MATAVPAPRNRRRLGPLLVGIAGVLLLVLLLVLWAAPSLIASQFVQGNHPFTVGEGAGAKTYTASVNDVRLSWFGGQRVGSVIVKDTAGATLADLQLAADKSLLGLALGGGDIGAVTLAGSVNVREDQLPVAAPGQPPVVDATKPQPPATTAGASQPVQIPAGTKVQFHAQKLDITYTPAAPGTRPVKIEDLDAKLDFTARGASTLVVTAAAPTLSVDARASNLFDNSGTMTLPQSDITLSASLDAPADIFDAIVRLATANAREASVDPAGNGGSLRATLGVVAQGGRLKLADATKPLIVEASVPASLVESFAGDNTRVALSSTPSLKAVVSVLDLPLPDMTGSGAALDLRGAGLRAALTTSVIEGSATLGEGSVRQFRVEPIDFQADATDLASIVSVQGSTRATLDGVEAGMVRVDVEAQRLLDDKGAVRAGIPGSVRGVLELKGVPTRLADPMLASTGIVLAEVVGESIDATLQARTREGAASAAVPPTDVTLEFTATHASGHAMLVVDQTRISTDQPSPIAISAQRLGPALRAVMKDSAFEFADAGQASVEITDLDIPLLGDGRPDLAKASLTLRAPVRDVTITSGVGDGPLVLRSLDTQATLRPDTAPAVTLDWTLQSGARPTRTTGNMSVQNLLVKQADGTLALAPAAARPVGVIEIVDLPSSLMGYLPADLRGPVAQSVGPDVDITLTTSAGRTPEGLLVDLDVAADGLTGGGRMEYTGKAITAGSPGLTLAMQRPGALAEALTRGQEGSPVERLSWNAPLTLSLSDVNVSMPEAGKAFNPGSVFAKVALETGGLNVTLRDQGAGASAAQRALAVESIDLNLMHDPTAGAALTLAGKGSQGGQAFTMNGDIALGRVFDDAGQVNLATVAPKGRVELSGVPTVIASIFDAKNGPLAAEAIGPTMDLLVVAPAPPSEGAENPPARSAALSIRGASLTASASAGIDGKVVSLGGVNARATLRPRLVEAAMRVYAPQMSQPPALDRDAVVQLAVLPARVTLDAQNKPDMRTLTPVRATLTSDGDVVLRNLPGGADGKLLSAGVRNLVAGVGYVSSDQRQNEASLRCELLDPDQQSTRLALVDVAASGFIVESGAMPPNFTAALKAIDTARLDTWLGRPGLTAELLGADAGLAAEGSVENRRARIKAIVQSERLDTTIALTQQQDRLVLDQPARLQWQMSPQWANAYAAPKDEEGRPTVTFVGATALDVELRELTIAYPEAYLRPDVFKLAARAASPKIALRTADGQNVSFDQFSATVGTASAPGSLAFDLSTQVVTDQGATRQPVIVKGNIADALKADGSGFDQFRAKVTADVDGSVPTAVLDALGNQQGMLVDLLGGTTNLDARLVNFSRDTGAISVQVNTDNARAKLVGDVRGGAIVTSEPANVTLTRITKELSARYIETVVPLMSGVEKTADDQPATVDATQLTLPTDGDTRKLNGLVTVDMGTVRFNTSDWFGGLVKLAGGKKGGKIGERIKPFEFVVREGVITYEKIEIPLGEFNVETRGTVDLNEKYIDIVTFVPLYAVAEEVSGALKNIPGLDRLTQVPIRTHGPFGKTKSEPQLDLIVKEGIPGAIEKIIPKGLPGDAGKVLDEIFKKKK
jgi:hypothetical protein